MSIKKGDAAPLFKLFDTEKKEISLSDYKGQNVLLLFFPFAFSGTCTTEVCAMRDDIATYSKLNAVVFGLSIDSLFSLARFKEEQHLPFALLSDFNKTVAKQYDCLYDTFVFGTEGVAKRSAFIIDKNGIIQYAEVLEKAGELPNFDAIKSTLASL